MTFERTADLALVREILTNPTVWPYIGDDFSPPKEEWQPNDDHRIWYVLAKEKGPIGLFTFLPRSTVLWESHIALLRDRKASGADIVRGVFRWMFDHSTAERIIGEIPACNTLAVRLAEGTMNYFGVNRGAFRKAGRLEDLLLFGVSKEDICQVY